MTWTERNLNLVRRCFVWSPCIPVQRLNRLEIYLLSRTFRRQPCKVRA